MPIIFAAGAIPSFLTEVVALLVAGAVIAYICNRFGLVPIVGFLVAGVIIGPNALRLVQDQALVDAAAEVGVILLLFTIGIEFSLEKLAKIKRLIFGGGGLQVVSATLLMTGVLAAFGIDWRAGLFTGFLVALSSTAIVLKLLGDRGETNDTQGQVGLGLLIFQDLAIIVMVLLVPMLGGSGGSAFDILWALAKAGGIIAIVLLFARRLMPKLLEVVARSCSPELFLLSVIAICFGTAYLTSMAGVSLSLGAFLAGLLVSESRFSEHALSEIMPLQILFSATFFVSVGMLLDLRFLVQNLPLVLAAIFLVLAVKVITTGLSVVVLGYQLPIAAAAGLMLAQVGEFSFVLERAGRDAGLTPAGLGAPGSQTFIASTVVLMVLTPLLMQIGSKLSRGLERKRTAHEAARIVERPVTEGQLEKLSQMEDHVIVAGYGEAARRLVRVLGGSGIPYVITTLSPAGANEAEAEGLPVMRGDASHQRTLQLAGVERAKMMVIADDDPATARRIASVARVTNPTMRIVVRTRRIAEVESLIGAGVDRVIAEELESIVGLFSDVLRDYRIPAEEIDAHEEAMRRGGYAALLPRDPAKGGRPAVECDVPEECLDTRTVTIRDGAPVTTQSLAELKLQENHGIAIHTLRRDGEAIDDPPGDFVLKPGDEVVLQGTAAAFVRGAALFRLPTSSSSDSVAAGTPAATATTNGNNNHNPDAPAIDTEQVIELKLDPSSSVPCSHLKMTRAVMPSARGCEECLQTGDTWVHLRLCMTCGHVGCCDSSKNKHAAKHFPATDHPIIKSLEKGEDWAWCYADETYL